MHQFTSFHALVLFAILFAANNMAGRTNLIRPRWGSDRGRQARTINRMNLINDISLMAMLLIGLYTTVEVLNELRTAEASTILFDVTCASLAFGFMHKAYSNGRVCKSWLDRYNRI